MSGSSSSKSGGGRGALKRGLGSSPLGGRGKAAGLGAGIGALIPGDQRQGELREVAIEQIEPNPDQPRKRFAQGALEELARSIEAQGVIQPIIVTRLDREGGRAQIKRHDQRYLIIAGERRWRAAQLAGLAQIPVICRALSEQASFEIALLENLQRVDLNPLEEAAAYQRLIDEFDLSHSDLATRTGKSRAAITNSLRLLKLPPEIAAHLEVGSLSAGHGRALLPIEDHDTQRDLAMAAREAQWSVRELERRVKAHLERTQEREESSDDTTAQDESAPWIAELLERAESTLQRSVSAHASAHLRLKVSGRGGGAQVKIDVSDAEAAAELLRLLSGEPTLG